VGVEKVVGIDRASPDRGFWLLKPAGITIPKSLSPFNNLFPLARLKLRNADCGMRIDKENQEKEPQE
jgi:hypothetical protein